MRLARLTIPLAAVALLFAACASQKEPAEQAVSKVDAALTELRADAEKYAADDLKDVDARPKLRSFAEMVREAWQRRRARAHEPDR